MGRSAIDISGQRFGALLALTQSAECSKHRSALWVCRCDCGREVVVRSEKLRLGRQRSCGCRILGRRTVKSSGVMPQADPGGAQR